MSHNNEPGAAPYTAPLIKDPTANENVASATPDFVSVDKKVNQSGNANEIEPGIANAHYSGKSNETHGMTSQPNSVPNAAPPMYQANYQQPYAGQNFQAQPNYNNPVQPNYNNSAPVNSIPYPSNPNYAVQPSNLQQIYNSHPTFAPNQQNYAVPPQGPVYYPAYGSSYQVGYVQLPNQTTIIREPEVNHCHHCLIFCFFSPWIICWCAACCGLGCQDPCNN